MFRCSKWEREREEKDNLLRVYTILFVTTGSSKQCMAAVMRCCSCYVIILCTWGLPYYFVFAGVVLYMLQVFRSREVQAVKLSGLFLISKSRSV